MDERIRLMKRVRVVLRIAQWILLLYVAGSTVRAYFGHSAARMYRDYTLQQAHYPVFRTFMDYSEDVVRTMALFPPPSDPALRNTWADSIQIYTGKETGVFIVNGAKVDWVRKPASLGIYADSVEARIAEPAKKLRFFSLGSYTQRYLTAHEAKPYEYSWTAEVVQSPDGQQAWGIVHRRVDLWRPICERLKAAAARKPNDLIDPLPERLNGTLQINPVRIFRRWMMHTGAQIFVGKEELFASPGLDTTMQCKVDSIGGAQVMFYLANQDNLYAEMIGGRGYPWGGLIIWLLLLVGNELCYRWLRKAEKIKTEPQIPVAG